MTSILSLDKLAGFMTKRCKPLLRKQSFALFFPLKILKTSKKHKSKPEKEVWARIKSYATFYLEQEIFDHIHCWGLFGEARNWNN
jgi:hypothetical protein